MINSTYLKRVRIGQLVTTVLNGIFCIVTLGVLAGGNNEGGLIYSLFPITLGIGTIVYYLKKHNMEAGVKNKQIYVDVLVTLMFISSVMEMTSSLSASAQQYDINQRALAGITLAFIWINSVFFSLTTFCTLKVWHNQRKPGPSEEVEDGKTKHDTLEEDKDETKNRPKIFEDDDETKTKPEIFNDGDETETEPEIFNDDEDETKTRPEIFEEIEDVKTET